MTVWLAQLEVVAQYLMCHNLCCDINGLAVLRITALCCRYLANNAQMQEVVNTLLELAHLPPHPSLHAGKTTISIASECDHDRITGLVGVSGLDSGRFRYQVSQAAAAPAASPVYC